MKGKVFLDTNVFVYTQSASEEEKRKISLSVLEKYDCCASTQVLCEFCNVTLKKLKMRIEDVRQIVNAINDSCDILLIDFETLQKALSIKERYGFSFYDSVVLASAVLGDCAYVFSEDLQDGQVIDGNLEIVNIFARKNFEI
ncbi:MAG: PIN domain-containing protein [Oscillospiraceae bacterium]|nr:PIN domain-containing protein [Oscillospiraceae bacterium]